MFDEETLELIERTRILEHFMLNKVPDGPWRLVGTDSVIGNRDAMFLVTVATGETAQEAIRNGIARIPLGRR